MNISAVALLLMMVGSSLGQSGDSHDSEDDEDFDFECYSVFRMNDVRLICNVTGSPPDDMGNIFFNVCKHNECSIHKEGENIQVNGEDYECSVSIWGTRQPWKDYNLLKIAKPDTPNISIYYNNQTEEYIFDLRAPYTGHELLKDCLIYETVVREEGEEWPACEKQAVRNGVRKWRFQNNLVHVPMRNFDSSTKYEVKVRSKPHGKQCGGFWSSWSETAHFETGPVTDDENLDFECYAKISLYINKIICNAIGRPPNSTGNIYFIVCKQNSSECSIHKEGEEIRANEGEHARSVFMLWGTHRRWKYYDLFKIAKPDTPNISIYYNNQSEEYIFDLRAPYTGYELLKDCLIYETVVRKEGEDWPTCENQAVRHGVRKRCFQNVFVHVPKRNLDYSTKYEAKVRAKPNGGYFDGFWSSWSQTTLFETEPDELNGNVASEDLLIVSFSCCAVALILIIAIILMKFFWKDRIKPVIWPELPDHKSALEKLCIPPAKYKQISFNPDYFDNYNINKVDYMKAQVRAEDCLQVIIPDTQLEKHPATDGCNDTSPPGEGSRESSAVICQNREAKEPAKHTAATGPPENMAVEESKNPENVSLPTSDDGLKCTTSDESPVTPGAGQENVSTYSSAVKQPTNELSRLCWEDISMYIAMSAFKTPNGATIKQPINI